MDEKIYRIWLKSIQGVGNKTGDKLIEYFGSAENIFYASVQTIRKVKGINSNVINAIIENKNVEKINILIENIKKYNVDVIGKDDEEYPENLKHIYDSPFILYKKGSILEKDRNAIAIVGARKASSYGKYVAYSLAKELAKKGITVVSGMAYGVDTMAHKGAIENGGRTFAVLGCGLDDCYPKSNKHLMLEIEKNGAVLSEYNIGVKPMPQHFPARNRIISGVVKGVIVVEASIKSGSLITAELALEQGREVFAVPGNINSTLSMGTNKLIKEGAKLITGIEDVLEDLNIKTKEKKKNIQLSELEAEIYNLILENQPIHVELLLKDLKWSIDQVNSVVTILELKGLIDQLPGRLLIIK